MKLSVADCLLAQPDSMKLMIRTNKNVLNLVFIDLFFISCKLPNETVEKLF